MVRGILLLAKAKSSKNFYKDFYFKILRFAQNDNFNDFAESTLESLQTIEVMAVWLLYL